MPPEPPKPAGSKLPRNALERVRVAIGGDSIKVDRKLREYTEDPNDPLLLCFSAILNQTANLGQIQQEQIRKGLLAGFDNLREDSRKAEKRKGRRKDIAFGAALAIITGLLVWLVTLQHTPPAAEVSSGLRLTVPTSWLSITDRGDRSLIVIRIPEPDPQPTK